VGLHLGNILKLKAEKDFHRRKPTYIYYGDKICQIAKMLGIDLLVQTQINQIAVKLQSTLIRRHQHSSMNDLNLPPLEML
jgi:hypothetical protein